MSTQRNRKPGNAVVGLTLLSGVVTGAAALGAAPAAPKIPASALRQPATPAPAPGTSPEAAEFFEKKVRPILSESCFSCHNSKLASPMGALRLDARALALKGGDRGPSVVPGHPDKSLLVKAIEYKDRTLQMPPKGKLRPEQIEVLVEWVKMGAPWPGDTGKAPVPQAGVFDLKARRDGHWSFQPLQRPALPAVKRKEWVQSPVDHFTLAKLEAKGLAPAAPADRRTLLRRITFDLTGLPPTPAEIEAFVSDRAPNAYEKVVDRLLASPGYGERWARHWLDLVRYAETDGHEFDFEKPNAWAYRDYVIRAFNEDVPYNQFVREHIAGDMLPNPRRNATDRSNESLIATGFWFLGEGKHSPVDLLEDESERVDNQIDVLSKAFLGLSVGCARCHDHKFDPIATKDYYALSGILKSSRYELANINDPAPTQQVVAELQKLRQRMAPLALEAAACGPARKSPEFARYLLTARGVLTPSVEAATPAVQPGDVVFEDFEKSSYEGWTTTGTAFGDRPNRRPIPEYQGDINALGNGFVNTHSWFKGSEKPAGDNATGTLTSRPFTIDKPYIRFLIGGGSHAGKTCLNVKVEGKVARTATGKDNNRMDWAELNVRDLIGKTAQIEIVDDVTGAWGNIGVDQITFTNASGGEDQRINLAAQRGGVDAPLLQRWVRQLRDRSAKDLADPLHPAAALAGVPNDRFPAAKDDLLRRLKAVPAAARPGETVYADFEGTGFGDWNARGEAFGSGPSTAPSVRFDAKSGDLSTIQPGGAADSGHLSDRLHGVLRSPLFRIEKKHILYRMAGRDTQVNLIIDNFQRIRAPIYGGLTINVRKNDTPDWYVQDVEQWIGHKAYIEFVDRSGGYLSVDEVRFSDENGPAAAPNPLAVRLLEDPSVVSYDTLAEAYGRLLTDVATAPGTDRSRVAILDSMARAGLTEADDSAELRALRAEQAKLEERLPNPVLVMAAVEGPGEDDRVHVRGRHQTLGDVVPRRFLEAVSGPTQPAVKQGSGRLELAERMVSTNDPLLPRVLVNRVWQHHFTEGLVRTVDDFGLRGEKPTHPELLDWLSSSFVSSGPNGCNWSVKKLHRLILLSSTYQMASQGDPKAEAADPQNKLLHRMPVRRLEAEAIRDSVLAISGKLEQKMYGPGVLPFLTPFMAGRGRPDSSGPLDGSGRRSVYINVRRNFLTPMFLAFDYPIPFTTIGRRSVSTVPAQALTLMNNPFVVQQAGYWGRRVLELPDLTPRQRIVRMYTEAYARTPSEPEVSAALVFITDQDRAYGTPNDPRSWGDLAHVLINVKEFIFVN